MRLFKVPGGLHGQQGVLRRRQQYLLWVYFTSSEDKPLENGGLVLSCLPA